MMHGFPYLSVLTLLPLVGAVVVALVPRTKPQLAKVIALLWSLAVLGFGIAMWVAFKANGPRFQFRESYAVDLRSSARASRCRPTASRWS